MTQDSGTSYLRSEGQILVVVGVRDMVVVATADAVLVAPLGRAQDVRQVVDRLKLEGTGQHASHVKVFRPWGSYQSIDAGHYFQVKQLTVKPGARLSLQLHRQRAEHWVVVEGQARVTRGEEFFDRGPNQSTYIPASTACKWARFVKLRSDPRLLPVLGVLFRKVSHDEVPERAEVVIDTRDLAPELAAHRILVKLESLGYIR